MAYARIAACSLLLFLGGAASDGYANPIRLPDIGDSSTTVASPQEEKEVGREIVRSLRRSGQIIDDPFLNDYVRRLGYRLALASGSESELTFFVLENPSINAFALPGGYIGINAGLVTASRSESELAGVIAHEISHVTQHHILRGMEKAAKMDLPMKAALIAAIVLGSQDPQAGQAAIMGALASASQAQLDFTRAHEQEADRIGLGILAEAGFDPEGMPAFFERLHQETRFSGSESVELEFLRTHPVTLSRIADTRNRARQHAPARLAPPDVDYEFAKAILKVRAGRDPQAALRHFRHALANGHFQNASAAHLGQALAHLALQQPSEARAQLSLASAGKEPTALLISTQAKIERSEGNTSKAEKLLQQGLRLYPENEALTLDYARLLVDTRRYQEATNVASAHVRNHGSPGAYAILAEAEDARGKRSASHMAQAERYYLLDEIPLAMDQLKIARNDPEADFYTLSRIDARMGELKLLIRKSPRKTE